MIVFLKGRAWGPCGWQALAARARAGGRGGEEGRGLAKFGNGRDVAMGGRDVGTVRATRRDVIVGMTDGVRRVRARKGHAHREGRDPFPSSGLSGGAGARAAASGTCRRRRDVPEET